MTNNIYVLKMLVLEIAIKKLLRYISLGRKEKVIAP